MDSRSISKTLRDGFVVVASILIAFGLEAWWDEHQLDADVQSDLASVQEQLEQVRARVESASQRVSRIMSASEELLDRLNSESELAVVSVPDTLAWWTADAAPTLDVSIGAVEALIASGRFGAVRSPEVRLGLSSLQGQIEDVVEDQVIGRDYGLSVLGPRLDAVLDRSHFNLFRAAPDFPFGQTATPTFGSIRFPNSLEVRNGIFVRMQYYSRSMLAMETLDASLDHIVELLSQEVSPGSEAVAP